MKQLTSSKQRSPDKSPKKKKKSPRSKKEKALREKMEAAKREVEANQVNHVFHREQHIRKP